MNKELVQIKGSFERLGMTPEQIAEDRRMDVVAVKAALMQSSSVYRKECNLSPINDDSLNFSDQQLSDVNDVIYNTAMHADDPHLAFKAATYIRDDKRGRKDVVRALRDSGFNILVFNQSLQNARELADRAKQRITGGVGNQLIEA